MSRRLLCAGLLSVALAGGAHAMCGAFVRPQEPVLVSGDQRLFVFWRNGVQHLILENGYKGKAKDFGMILPLPAPPEVKKVDRKFFRELWQLTSVGRRGMRPGARLESAGGSKASQDGGVEVISRQVAGVFEAVTLKADTTAAFTRWMDRYGYRYTDESVSTFQYYVSKGWYFVAIKVQMGKDAGEFNGALQPMGFRFRTDKMVLPTRMASINPRGMNVDMYFLAPSPVQLPDFQQVPGMRQFRAKVDANRLRAFPTLAAELDRDVFFNGQRKDLGTGRAEQLKSAQPDAYARKLLNRYRGLWLVRYRGFFPRAKMLQGDLTLRYEQPFTKARVTALVQQLGDTNEAKATQAHDTLVAAGPPAVPALIEQLGHSDYRVRRRVAEILGGIEHRSAIAPLITRLKTETDRFVQSGLGRALRDITGQELPSYDADAWAAWWAKQPESGK